MAKLIALTSIDNVIKLALWSAYLADEAQPVSLLLCANPEAGKTETVHQASQLPGIVYPSDCTAYGILSAYGEDISQRKVRHLIIPDLLTPFSKRWDTAASFAAFLNNLVAEGIIESRTKAISKHFTNLVKCGLIGCITPRELKDQRHKWLGMGFMSRLLPVSWDYKPTTQAAIFQFIIQGKQSKDLWDWSFPDRDVQVQLDPALATSLLQFSTQFGEAQRTYGFRYQHHLQRLLKASALADKRDIVMGKDLDHILSFIDYLNLGHNGL